MNTTYTLPFSGYRTVTLLRLPTWKINKKDAANTQLAAFLSFCSILVSKTQYESTVKWTTKTRNLFCNIAAKRIIGATTRGHG